MATFTQNQNRPVVKVFLDEKCTKPLAFNANNVASIEGKLAESLCKGETVPAWTRADDAAYFILTLSVGKTSENAAIQTMTRSGNGSVFLRLANYGRTARDLKVEMRADGRLVDVLPVKLEGNTTSDLTWNRLASSTQVLEARLTPSSADTRMVA